MYRFVVVGCGKQGEQVVRYLLKQGYEVLGIDLNDPSIPEMLWIEMNVASDPQKLTNLIKFMNPNGVVCALPEKHAAQAQIALAKTGTNVIDMCFNEPDYDLLEMLAKKHGTLYVPDCGFAPGIPNLIVGDELRKKGDLQEVVIHVGGVPIELSEQGAHVEGFDRESLAAEYVRDARYCHRGKILQAKTLDSIGIFFDKWSDCYQVFRTDGLRTLLNLRNRVDVIEEFTIRHPWHLQKVIDWLKDPKKTVKQYFEEHKPEPIDRILMNVRIDDKEFTLDVAGSKELSAMSKVTGYAAGVVAEVLVLKNEELENLRGFVPPEMLAERVEIWSLIRDLLGEQEICVRALDKNNLGG